MKYYGWFVDVIDCVNFFAVLIPFDSSGGSPRQLSGVRTKSVEYVEGSQTFKEDAYLCHLAETRLSSDWKSPNFRTLKYLTLRWFFCQEKWFILDVIGVDNKGRILSQVTSILPGTKYPYMDIPYTPPETLRNYLQKAVKELNIDGVLFNREKSSEKRRNQGSQKNES